VRGYKYNGIILSCLFGFLGQLLYDEAERVGHFVTGYPWMMDELWMNLGLGARIPGVGIDSYFWCIFLLDIALRHMA
jgi:hypothetical protein